MSHLVQGVVGVLAFGLVGVLPVWAMLNDKRDLARRKQDALDADLSEGDRIGTGYSPGSIGHDLGSVR